MDENDVTHVLTVFCLLENSVKSVKDKEKQRSPQDQQEYEYEQGNASTKFKGLSFSIHCIVNI